MTQVEWDHLCDVLVVGSGAGGLTSAIVAADGHADVLVIEKGRRYGGTSATSGGMIWVPCNHLAAALGHEDNADDAFTYMRGLIDEDVPDALIRSYIQHSPEMLKYVLDNTHVEFQALPYPDYQAEREGGRIGWRTLEPLPYDGKNLGKSFDTLEPPLPANILFGRYGWTVFEAATLMMRPKGWLRTLVKVIVRYHADIRQRLKSRHSRFLTSGGSLVGRLRRSLDDRKIPLWTYTRLIRLEQDADGRVVGVVAEKDGRAIRIGARKGVILATGGFERNGELRARFGNGSARPEASSSQINNTGDGVVAAMDRNIEVARMDSAWRVPAIRVPGQERATPIFFERSLPGSMMVDVAGRRFVNESADYHLLSQAMMATNGAQNGDQPVYALFDGRFHERYPMGPVLPMMPQWLMGAAARSVLVSAPTIRDLALKLKMDPAVLEGSVARFNGFAQSGKDEDFGRGDHAYDKLIADPRAGVNSNLAPLDQPPYFAVPIHLGDIGTNGGVVTDPVGRALSQDGKVVDGLYACGNVTASVMGRSYPGGGATLGPAMTFAFLAARHATGKN